MFAREKNLRDKKSASNNWNLIKKPQWTDHWLKTSERISNWIAWIKKCEKRNHRKLEHTYCGKSNLILLSSTHMDQ